MPALRKFAVVTDSASDINHETAERLGIRVVPLHIMVDGRDYRDGVDIQIGEYLDLLGEQKELPRTSQPSPAEFVEVYRQLADEGYTDILSIHIARELSATIETPRFLARQMPDGMRLEVIDSYSATVGEGAMVLEAAAIAEAGGTIDEAIERVLAIRDTAKIYFIPDNLGNLVKGGRATRAQHLATSILNVKVVIEEGEGGRIEVAHMGRSPTTSCTRAPTARWPCWRSRSRPTSWTAPAPAWPPSGRASPRMWATARSASCATRRRCTVPCWTGSRCSSTRRARNRRPRRLGPCGTRRPAGPFRCARRAPTAVSGRLPRSHPYRIPSEKGAP